MPEDLTITNEETTEEIADNSEVIENDEPVQADNSETEQETKEPETKEEVVNEQPKGKFNTIEEATRGYAELEKKLGQQSNELGELRRYKQEQENAIKAQKEKEAQENGFETVQEYVDHKAVAEHIASAYKKHLSECDYPEEMEALLNQYKANPTDELLETIEAEFPLSTVKNIAVGVDLFKGELQQKAQEAQIEELTQSAKEYLSENVNKYKEEFKNPAFAVLYGEAFKALGCSLDTDLFVNMLNEFAKEVIKADGFRKEVAKENTDATDEIAGLSLGNSAKQSDSLSEKLLTDMTQEELEQYLTKHK